MAKTSNINLLHWWQRSVIYQIYPRSFKDTTGNGVGDLEGIIAKLEYLNDDTPNSLGIDAIWISPFYPSPMADFGYDVANYCDVDPLFGNLDIFDRLLTQAHRRGIKIIIDYVPNHTSDQHPWFQESRRSRSSPKRNWYIWRDRNPGGSFPNNWGSAFGGPAWTWDEQNRQYYFHHFLKEQPELNWREPAVRSAMFDALHFWLKRGVDGIRIDVAGMLIKDPDLRNNPPNPDADPNLPPNDIFGRQLHLYNEDQDEVQEIIRQFRRLLDQYGDRCAIGEIWYRLPRWIRYYGQNGDGLHMPFNFRLMNQPWEANAIRQSVDELEKALPSFAWPNYVLGSHDANRLASRIGPLQARVAAMLLLTLRGTPTLYYGDELGMENVAIPASKMQDPQGHRLGAARSRDGGRTPMQWDDIANAGFSTHEPWLPISPEHKTRNVACLSTEPTSILNLYRRLLWYRHSTPALQVGTYRPIDAGNNSCYVFARKHSNVSCIVALNFTNQTCSLSVPQGGNGKLVLSTYLDQEGTVSLSNLQLRSNEGIIVELNQ